MSGLGSRLKDRVKRSLPALGSIIEIETSTPTVVLTYDDGPHPVGTDGVLRSLADAGATATFFVLLSSARRHPELIPRITAEGHEIALHGVDHRRLTAFTAEQVTRRTVDAKHELEDLAGTPVRWFRPPYGAQHLATWRAIRRADLESVLWSATTWDARAVAAEERVAHALADCRPGTILLAHDAFAGPADGVDDGAEPEVDRGALIATLLAEFRARGWVGRSLADALEHGRPVKSAVFSS
ncbi:polysaccharide deacetylase family protein [uncultured Plantibacter sp.]|uniref:polysaccharide deacetylase family protein n=1 Tax=uncultured Plantibacter sp. TaxID=293337 RepID=UPI0028D197C5|nr:polysaccharide deacetylase family protein [uncultured Plantibacter sp.]